MTRIGLVAAWLLAVGVTTAVAWQVVGAADDQVGDAPLTPLVAVTTSATTAGTTASITDPSAPSTTTTSVMPDDRDAPTTSTTTGTVATTTPSTAPASSTTSTTQPLLSTTPVPTTLGTQTTRTAVSDGGSVTVSGAGTTVELVAVIASPGWSYDVTRNDGQRVEVRFENQAGDTIRIRAEWDNGELIASVDS